MKLAMYKGPPTGILNEIGHAAVCLFTRSKYSHVELVIQGVCYTSSNRDGGVRGKSIDLTSGHWDLFDIQGDETGALAWFAQHDQENYDWAGVLRFAFKFLPNRTSQWFCSEAVAAALGYEPSDQYTPQSLLDKALGA